MISKSKALVLGITFKENCSDIRNSKVIDVVKELEQFNVGVDVYDPHADKFEVAAEYGIELIESIQNKYDAIILAVSHENFRSIDLINFKNSVNSVVFDLKGFLDRSLVNARL